MSKTIYGVNRGNLGELEKIVRGKCTGFIVRGTGYGLTDIEIFNINLINWMLVKKQLQEIAIEGQGPYKDSFFCFAKFTSLFMKETIKISLI